MSAGTWDDCLAAALSCLVGLSKLSLKNAELDTLECCSVLTNLRSLHAGCNPITSLESLSSCLKLTDLNLQLPRPDLDQWPPDDEGPS